MKNDFLKDKIKKELNKNYFQFSVAYLIPFFILLFIDIIYIFYCTGHSVQDVGLFLEQYSSIILILINLITLFYNFRKNKHDKINFIKENTAKLKISIEAEIHTNDVILKCFVKNISKADFSLKNCYVYIDSGIYNTLTKEYEFPFLQNRNIDIADKSDSDCIACFYCKNKICHYPENLINTSTTENDLNYKCYNLNHLSLDSLAYIGSNESFNQELVIHLEKGIYRALMVAVPDESCDCKCYSVCFVID